MKYKILLLFVVLFSFSCSKTTTRRPINPKKSTTVYFEAMQQNKILNKQADEEVLRYVKRDSTNKYIQSTNGFWYTYINKITDSLPTPKAGDEVEFTYNIVALNDSIIYGKEALGLKNYLVDKEDFISGLQKGIKLMKTGETITFVLPSYTAFGITGDNNKIGVNQSIKSTVTLINIK